MVNTGSGIHPHRHVFLGIYANLARARKRSLQRHCGRLELHIPDGKFLDCSLSAESNKASAFKLTPLDDNRIAIDFSHLNTGDGVAFSVLHTGGSDSDLQIRGELIGFGPPRPCKYDPPGTTGCIIVLISFLEIAIARFLDAMLSPSSRPAMLLAT
jgi:hypothetical protein